MEGRRGGGGGRKPSDERRGSDSSSASSPSSTPRQKRKKEEKEKEKEKDNDEPQATPSRTKRKIERGGGGSSGNNSSSSKKNLGLRMRGLRSGSTSSSSPSNSIKIDPDPEGDAILAKYLGAAMTVGIGGGSGSNLLSSPSIQQRGGVGASPDKSSSSQAVGPASTKTAAPPLSTEEEATIKGSIDSLMSILETEQLGPAVRSVFEHERERAFLKTLNFFVRHKDREIQDICNFHYQDFIHSVDELLTVRLDTTKLREFIINLNQEIQESGKALLEKSNTLLQYRATQRNISLAIEEINHCIFVLNQCTKVNEYIKEGKFYPALRILDRLGEDLLGSLYKYEFAKYLERKIPVLKETIKKCVTNEFNDWLVKVREVSKRIGEVALSKVAAEMQAEEKWKEELLIKSRAAKGEEGILDKSGGSSPSSSSSSSLSSSNEAKKLKGSRIEKKGKGSRIEKKGAGKHNRSTSDPGARDTSIDQSLWEKVPDLTFTPVYRALYIYEKLDNLLDFQNYYKYTRQLQANLVLQPPVSGGSNAFLNNKNQYQLYFYQIIGFFIIEMHVLHTSKNVTTLPNIKALWNTAISKIKAILQEQLNFINETVLLQQVKDFMVLFAKTMQKFEYETLSLYDFLHIICDKYFELATEENRLAFVEVLENENYTPITIKNEEEYDFMIADNYLNKLYPLKSLPQEFPFSSLVPQFLSIVRHFVTKYYTFSTNLSNIDETIKRDTDQLLRTLTQQMNNILRDPSKTNVYAIVQITLNLPVLKRACPLIEEFLASFRYGGKAKIVLDTSIFDTLEQNAEARLLEIMDRKVDTLFDNVVIDWAPSTAAREERDWIRELFLYVETTMTIFQPLAKELRNDINLRALTNIGYNMKALIYDTPDRRVTMAGVISFDKDLQYAENKARLQGFTRISHFLELRQLVNLLLSDCMEDFLDTRIRDSRYYLLDDIPKLLSVLEKYEAETTLGRFAFSSGSSKRRKVESLMKALMMKNSM